MAVKKKPVYRNRAQREATLAAFRGGKTVALCDTETTGLTDRDVIIQFSGILFKLSPDGNMTELERIDTLINPERSLPPKITEITGWTDADLIKAPKEPEVFPKIQAFLAKADLFVAYNTPFDIKKVQAMFARYGILYKPETLDILIMAKDAKPDASSHKLGIMVEEYGLNDGLSFHNAMDDVVAASRLMRVFYKEYAAKAEDTATKTIASVGDINYWKGYRGFDRVYVNTSVGSFFYDIRKGVWGMKKDAAYTVEDFDMKRVVSKILEKAGVADEKALVAFAKQKVATAKSA